MVFRCSYGCASLYQDQKYGQGMRVQNRTKQASSGSQTARCTICGKENNIPVDKQKER